MNLVKGQKSTKHNGQARIDQINVNIGAFSVHIIRNVYKKALWGQDLFYHPNVNL